MVMAKQIYFQHHNGKRLEKIKRDKQIKKEDYEQINKFKQHLKKPEEDNKRTKGKSSSLS